MTGPVYTILKNGKPLDTIASANSTPVTSPMEYRAVQLIYFMNKKRA